MDGGCRGAVGVEFTPKKVTCSQFYTRADDQATAVRYDRETGPEALASCFDGVVTLSSLPRN